MSPGPAGTIACATALFIICFGCASRSAALRTNQVRPIANSESQLLRARLERDPLDLQARLELARYYQRAGFPEIAIEHGRLACERAPESVEAHVALAKMLRANGKTGEAARELTAFAMRHDAEVEVWAWLGLLRDESGDWVSGEAAHRKAVALAPGRDDLRNNLGYGLLKQGRRDEAAVEFRAALEINAQSATARNNLALALIESGRYAEARREIEIALSYNQQHSAALKNLRLISQLDGKAAEIAAPARAGSRFARMRASWVRFWGGHGEDRVASR